MSTKARPILFSGLMVRAILEGKKRQTRRVLKKQPHPEAELRAIIPRPNAVGSCAYFAHIDAKGIHNHDLAVYCPYGMPGDRLWVLGASRIMLEITGVWVKRSQKREREKDQWFWVVEFCRVEKP